jgi:hypothetical protein
MASQPDVGTQKDQLINGPAVSFAQVLNPGYQKAGRKEEPS